MTDSAQATLRDLAHDIELARVLMKRGALIDANGSIWIGERARELAALSPRYHAWRIAISPDGSHLGLVKPVRPLALVTP